MKLYVFGNCYNNVNGQPGRGLISIMLPDLGVIYRTQFEGTQSQCEYTAALMAVKFVENNKKFLSKQKIEVLSDSAEMVNAVNGDQPVSMGSNGYRDMILMYLKKFNMKIAWVPRAENRAAQIVPELPPLTAKLDLNFDFGQKGNDSALLNVRSKDNSKQLNS
jgi:ribonuclease HI